MGGYCGAKSKDGEVILELEQNQVEKRNEFLKRCLTGCFRGNVSSIDEISKWANNLWKVSARVRVSRLLDGGLLFWFPLELEAHRILLSGSRVKGGIFLDLIPWTPSMEGRSSMVRAGIR